VPFISLQCKGSNWTGHWPAPKRAVREHCKALLVFNQRMPGTKLSVYSSLERRGFIYLSPERMQNLFRWGTRIASGRRNKKKESCKRDNYM
jgi:hypothetical protein